MKSTFAWRIALTALALALVLPGCKKKSKTAAADEEAQAAAPGAGLPPGGRQPPGLNPGIARMLPSVGRVNPTNDLQQIQKFYATDLALGSSPKRLEDMPDLRRDLPQVYKAIQDGVYVVYWGVSPNQLGAQAILAYVHDAPTRGGLVVLLDGTVHNLSAEEFQKTPKAGK